MPIYPHSDIRDSDGSKESACVTILSRIEALEKILAGTEVDCRNLAKLLSRTRREIGLDPET